MHNVIVNMFISNVNKSNMTDQTNYIFTKDCPSIRHTSIDNSIDTNMIWNVHNAIRENVFRYFFFVPFLDLFFWRSSNFNFFFGRCVRNSGEWNVHWRVETRLESMQCTEVQNKQKPKQGDRVCVTHAILIVHVCLYLKYYWINCSTR